MSRRGGFQGTEIGLIDRNLFPQWLRPLFLLVRSRALVRSYRLIRFLMYSLRFLDLVEKFNSLTTAAKNRAKASQPFALRVG